MVPYRFYKYTFQFVCVLLLLSILILGLTAERNYILESLAIGMLGVLIGFAPIAAINRFVRHPFMLALAYLVYIIAITIWNVQFPLLIVGVALSLMAIYLAGLIGNEFGTIRGKVILIGKYSLFGYMSQIAILQVLSSGLHRVNLGAAALPVSFIAAFALTIVSVEVLDRARAKMASVDRLYKAVFA